MVILDHDVPQNYLFLTSGACLVLHVSASRRVNLFTKRLFKKNKFPDKPAKDTLSVGHKEAHAIKSVCATPWLP